MDEKVDSIGAEPSQQTGRTLSSRPREKRPEWVAGLKRYETPHPGKVAIQLADTFLPYVALLVAMYLTMHLGLTYWITLALAIPAGGFLVRLFIFFHDCCHGSYLASQRSIRILGTLLGIITFTPFADWRHTHGVHHSTSGNLDRRGIGDVWTMTVEEYRASPRGRRIAYRLFRNPLVMFVFGPLFTFLIWARFPSPKPSRDQVVSVILTDLALAAIIAICAFTIGIKAYLLIQLPVALIAGALGIWLFYVQHQFDPSYWARTEEWGSMEAAMQGSSFYKLPRVLQWFSGNIGFHHIHHLRPRIPNYNLERAWREVPELQLENPLTLRRSLASVHLNLWDEAGKRLLSFTQAKRMLRGEPV